MNKIINILSLFLLSTIIACGGGGGSDPTPPANRPPSAIAPADFSAVEATQVTLNASGSNDSDGSISSYSWTQTAGTPTISLTNANSVSASFTAPSVDTNTQLTFQLAVTDNDGATNTDSIVVTITPDMPPQAVTANDFEAVELTTVSLDGSTSSDDISIESYLWEQTAGQSVTLSNTNQATASFTAPEITNQNLEMTFQLTVTDSVGATSMSSVNVTIIDTPQSVTLSGKITYDHVPHTVANALDYNNTFESNVRGATVELLNANGSSILNTATSDANGNYSFEVSINTSYIVRVKAELKKEDAVPTWDFTVVDNTNSQALYAMDSAVQAITTSSVILDINAASGWTGSSYSQPRVAAPFAILDSVYEAKEKVVDVDASVAMAPLKLNWSVNNAAIDGNTSLGQISTSHFNGTEIFILGDANGDTDEYDGHVIVHEWGHYFEGQLSRSDSIGGSHGGGDKLDFRVALGEGFGNALSGIITDDPFYRDSFGSNQSQGFDINVESNPSGTNKGWFSESSTQSLIYDFYDANSDGADGLSLGFAPIYNVLVGAERTTLAFTSIFSFANQLKIESSSNASAIDALLASQDITVTDDFGTGETNNGGDARNLPIYKSLPVGGSIEVCSFGTANAFYNKLGNRQYLIFEILNNGSYAFTATGQSVGDDPDFYVYKQGEFIFVSEDSGDESTNQNLVAGTYVMDAYEFSNVDTRMGAVQRNTCIDITLTAN